MANKINAIDVKGEMGNNDFEKELYEAFQEFDEDQSGTISKE